jgi:hypothetical protein
MELQEIHKILSDGFEALGISSAEVKYMRVQLRNAKTKEEAIEIFENFKNKVRKEYKQKALECHPDHGGDPEEFKKFGQIMNVLNKFKVDRTPQQMVKHPKHKVVSQVIIIETNSWYSSTNSSTTTNAYTNTYNPFSSK